MHRILTLALLALALLPAAAFAQQAAPAAALPAWEQLSDAQREQLLAGRQPRRLTLIWFQRNPIPVDWQQQRQIIQSFE